MTPSVRLHSRNHPKYPKELALFLLKQQSSIPNNPDTGGSVEQIVTELVEIAIDCADLTRNSAPSYGYGTAPLPPSFTIAMDLFELCIETSNLAACDRLISRLIDQASAASTCIVNVLFPMIPALRQHRIDLGTEPFARFCQRTIKLYCERILGPKPVEDSLDTAIRAQLQNLGCSLCCGDCDDSHEEVPHFFGKGHYHKKATGEKVTSSGGPAIESTVFGY